MFFLKRKHIKDFTDDELMSRYQKSGSSKYIGELFNRYTHLLFLVSMKYLKDEEESRDAVMIVFEKFLKQLKKKGEIRNLKGWLSTVTRNHCTDMLKHRKRKDAIQEEMKKSEEERMESAINNSLYSDDKDELNSFRLKKLQEAIKQLNAAQRTCISLFYLQKKSYKEVVALTGYSLKQVKSYIQNGKRNLKKHLERLEVHE